MDASSQIQQLPGFKISRSHFRIGTKIHISDFYYAKRFFQNSFYSVRLAFLIANDMDRLLGPEKLDLVRNQGLTLFGYGIYSELLLTQVEKFLRIKWNLTAELLNHNIVLDTETLELVKIMPPLKNLLVIVPIASTFSTSIKIEEQLRKKYPDGHVIPTHINVLYVSDGPLSNVVNSKEQDFGWEKKDPSNDTVTIKAYFDNQLKTQKYYLSLQSRWQSVESCEYCFPADKRMTSTQQRLSLLNERPLFETDRTAVTPTLIFDFPRGRHLDARQLGRKYILNNELIQYGHHTRNNSHFLFSIKTEEFFPKNYDQVSRWLKKLKDLAPFSTTYKDTDSVLIVSSCHYSNAAFIDLVNEKLFSSAATIIHYDPTNDYIQNFEMVYGEEIERADKIIFVDDALKSGDSFSKIHDFVDYTLKRHPESSRSEGISCCLVLVNVSQPFTMSSVERKLVECGKVHAFADLHLFTSLSHNETSPLVLEEDRYRLLVKDCFLDSLKVHFLKQTIKLAVGERDYDDDTKKDRHLVMMEATHRVYQYFTVNPNGERTLGSFTAFARELFSADLVPNSFAHRSDTTLTMKQKEDSLLKILSQSPFTQYEPLRKETFRWAIERLDKKIDEVDAAVDGDGLSAELFEDLKFLVRRAGLLNSNYLISQRAFDLLSALYDSEKNGLVRLIASEYSKLIDISAEQEKVSVERRIRNLRDFGIFYVAQVKELLLKNEDRSIKLEEMLLAQFLRSSPAHDQLLRIMIAENGIILQKFYDFISPMEQWEHIYSGHHDQADNWPIREFLEQAHIVNHHKYKAISRFFHEHTKEQQVAEDTPIQPAAARTDFVTYLWIRHYISFEHKKEKLLWQKTDEIFKKLKMLFACDPTLDRIGAFFVVKNSEESDPVVVYDKNHKGKGELAGLNFNIEAYSYMTNFLNGDLDESGTYHKSVIELKRDVNQKKWIDSYSTRDTHFIENLDYYIVPETCDRLVLVRLNKRNPDLSEKAQGLMGFYFSSQNQKITDPFIVRYFNLLRGPLSEFVEKHHENNEFRDWQIAQNNKRLALLSGHGREMLKELGKYGNPYIEIANLLEKLQLIILMNEQVGKMGSAKDIVEKFNHFFHMEGKMALAQGYFKAIEEMAGQIYEFPEIEDKIDCTIDPVEEPENLPFAFNTALLNLIIFEIIVNAKKNRWHFDGEKVGEVSQNSLSIKSRIFGPEKSRWLEVKITNTGPTIPFDDVRKLNSRSINLKPDDEIAGTALLKTLIREYLDGEINFSTPHQSKLKQLSSFSVTITLKEMLKNEQ